MTQAESPLVVSAEDDEDIQLLIRFALERSGFRLLGFGDAQAAMDAVADEVPALFLFDLRMPGLSGVEAAALLRDDPRLGAVPVVILTASMTEEHEVEAAAVGVARYLRKPISPLELVAVVSELTGRDT